MQATVLAFRANARHGVPNTEDERLSHAVYLMDSEVGLLRNEWDSLLPAVRGRLLMIATDEGFRAAAMLAHRARLSSTEVQHLVSGVNGTKSGLARPRWSRTSKPPSTSTASGSWRAGSRRSATPVGGVGRSRGWGWRWGHWGRYRRI